MTQEVHSLSRSNSITLKPTPNCVSNTFTHSQCAQFVLLQQPKAMSKVKQEKIKRLTEAEEIIKYLQR